MSDTRRFSGKWVKGVFGKALAPHLDAPLKAALKGVGVDIDGEFLSEYPRQAWLDALELVARSLYPNEEAAKSARALGQRLVRSLLERGKISSAVLAMAKLFGPQRVLRELVSHTASGTNYLEFELTQLASRHATLRFNDAAIADFLCGVIIGVLAAVGAKNPEVELAVVSPGQVELSFKWS